MNNQNIKKIRRSLAVFAGLAATLSASAQVIFSDSSPTIDGVGGWSLRATDAKTSFTTTTDSLTGGQALALAYSGTVTSATQSTLIGRSFTETTLTAGQTLRFQFDFHPTAGTSTILRFGLFDGTAAISGSGFNGYDTAGGYYALIRNNSASGNFIRRQNPVAVPTDSTSASNYSQLGSNTTNYTWDTLTAYTVTFDVLYNSATSGTVTTSIFDLGTSTVRYSVSGSWTTTPINTFDGAFIRLDQTGSNAVNFDNLSVSVLSSIPEPATYAVWIGLVVIGLTGYRRVRRV